MFAGVLQDVDRYSPAWWYADVPETAIIPLRKLEAVLPYLRQVQLSLTLCPHEALSMTDNAPELTGEAVQATPLRLYMVKGRDGDLHRSYSYCLPHLHGTEVCMPCDMQQGALLCFRWRSSQLDCP